MVRELPSNQGVLEVEEMSNTEKQRPSSSKEAKSADSLEDLRRQAAEQNDEIRRLRGLIQAEGQRDTRRGHYQKPLSGDMEEVELMQRRERALAEMDVDEVRRIDFQIDEIREKALGPAQKKNKKPRIIPMGQRDPLDYDVRPGYRRRLFNLDPGGRRWIQAMEAGWRPVREALTSPADLDVHRPSSLVESMTRKQVGNGVEAGLFEMPEELYQKIQREKWAKNDAREREMIQAQKSEITGGAERNAIGEIELT